MTNKAQLEEIAKQLSETRNLSRSSIATLEGLIAQTNDPQAKAELSKALEKVKRQEKNLSKVLGKTP